jgi:hypothetical protein
MLQSSRFQLNSGSRKGLGDRWMDCEIEKLQPTYHGAAKACRASNPRQTFWEEKERLETVPASVA